MGVSENRLVPLKPMVLLIIIPFLNGYNWEYTLFSDKPVYVSPFEFPLQKGWTCDKYNHLFWVNCRFLDWGWLPFCSKLHLGHIQLSFCSNSFFDFDSYVKTKTHFVAFWSCMICSWYSFFVEVASWISIL